MFLCTSVTDSSEHAFLTKISLLIFPYTFTGEGEHPCPADEPSSKGRCMNVRAYVDTARLAIVVVMDVISIPTNGRNRTRRTLSDSQAYTSSFFISISICL